MKCSGKEWDHCRVEKMGCKGCYYDENKNKEKGKKTKKNITRIWKSTDIDYETIFSRKRGKSIIKIGNMKLGGTDIKIEVSTKFNWLQKKLWKYLLNIDIEDIKEDE